MVPLGTLLDVRQVQGPELITRYNLYPAASIFGSAAPGFSSGQAIKMMEQMADQTLPEGMAYDWTSTSYQEKQVGTRLTSSMPLPLFWFIWCWPLSMRAGLHPGSDAGCPYGPRGGLPLLIIRDYENDLYTQVGLILMIALSSKNAILIVEFARDLRREGMSITEAAIEATRRRFRPIVMTSFAFIMGVVPLLIAFGPGAASQRAIGTVVFGGMLSSTLVAIPFVPVFYVATQSVSERLRKLRNQNSLISLFV